MPSRGRGARSPSIPPEARPRSTGPTVARTATSPIPPAPNIVETIAAADDSAFSATPFDPSSTKSFLENVRDWDRAAATALTPQGRADMAAAYAAAEAQTRLVATSSARAAAEKLPRRATSRKVWIRSSESIVSYMEMVLFFRRGFLIYNKNITPV